MMLLDYSFPATSLKFLRPFSPCKLRGLRVFASLVIVLTVGQAAAFHGKEKWGIDGYE